MKKGILTYLSKGRHKNLGDYMQSVAAAQFVGPEPVYLDRETLDAYDGEPAKLVMNGWFMFRPSHFPPSAKIDPLFVSFHVTPPIEDRFFTPQTIDYLKRFEPIGCRSKDVVDMLARHGIKGEFTSCLTLTLGMTFRHEVKPAARVVFVDPYFRRPDKNAIVAYLFYVLRHVPHVVRHFSAVRFLAEKFRIYSILPRSRFALVRWAYAAEFHRAYTSVFDEEVLLKSDYQSHKLRRTEAFSDDYLMQVARERLHGYENASFVVTSLMHCSLPCTAMGTPVWFVYDPPMMTGRFEGNLSFLNALRLDKNGRIDRQCDLLPEDGRIHLTSVPPVRTDHVPYAQRMIERVKAFMADE